MKIAVAVDKTLDWAWEVATDLERRLTLGIDVAVRDGRTFMVPKEDCETPRAALEQIRRVRAALSPLGSAAERPLYLWNGEEPPTPVEDALVVALEENSRLARENRTLRKEACQRESGEYADSDNPFGSDGWGDDDERRRGFA